MTRVTEGSLIAQFVRSLERARADSSSALEAITDGKRVRVASDDPIAASRALRTRARLARTEGYKRTGALVRADLTTIDTRLGEAFNLLTSAKTKAQAAISPNDQNALDALAVDVAGLRADLEDIANTRQRGRYLFAGTDTLSPAYNAAGNYTGNNDEVVAFIDDDVDVAVTLDGEEVFAGSSNNAFFALDALETALRANDTAGIQAAADQLTGIAEQISASRSEIGARLRTVDRTIERLEQEQVKLQIEIGEFEDISLERAAVELVQADQTTQAISQTATRLFGRSLFDYLG